MRRIILYFAILALAVLASPFAYAQLWSVPATPAFGLFSADEEAPASGTALLTHTNTDDRLLNFWWELDCGNGQAKVVGSKTDSQAYAFVNQCSYTAAGTYQPIATIWMAMGSFSFPVRQVNLDPVTVSAPSETVIIQDLAITACSLEPCTPTITATALGPAGAVDWDISCNGDDSVYEVQSADTDNSLSSVECEDLAASGIVPVTHTICLTATIGETTSDKACGQTTVNPQVITPIIFSSTPTSGVDPLEGVSLYAVWNSNGGNVDLTFKCAADSECPGDECHTVSDWSGGGYLTLQNGSFSCDYGEGTHLPSVLIEDEDGYAPSVTRTSSIVVTAEVSEDPIFGIRFVPDDAQCQIDGSGGCSVDLHPICSGDAAGPITAGTIDCGTDGTATLGDVEPASALGANLEQWSYWESGMPYCDRAKQASLDPSNNGGWSRAAGASDPAVNADGWPMSFTDGDGGGDAYLYTLLNRNVARVGADPDVGHYPEGTYSLTCTGEGTIGFGFDASGTDCTCPDTCAFDVTTASASGGIQIKVKAITAGPITFTVTDPGTCTGNWRDEFLDSIRGLRVLRFMDWMRTNWDPPTTWATRVSPTYRSYAFTEDGTGGVPAEVMVDLANTAGIDPWFTLPDAADDDYLESFAAEVCGTLDAERTLYVELGNEIWNFGYPFFNATNRAIAAGEAAPYGFTDNVAHRWKIARSMEMWEVFEATAGCSDARVVNVLGLQNADPPKSGSTFLDWDPDYAGAPAGVVSDWVEAVAVAPYWNLGDGTGGVYSLSPSDPQYAGIANTDCTADGVGPGYDVDCCTGAGTGECPNINVRDWTPDQFHESMIADIPHVLALSAEHAENLEPYGIPLVAYEGGNHVTDSADDATLDAARIAAHKDPGISAVLTELLDGWENLGGDLFVYYQLLGRCSVNNCWGAAEFMDELDDPLYGALVARTGLGCASSGTSCAWTSAGAKTISDSGFTREAVADTDASTDSVTVLAAPAVGTLSATCPQLTFVAGFGTGEDAPSCKTCSVTNTTGGTLDSTVVVSGASAWEEEPTALPADLSTTTETDDVEVCVPDPDDLGVGIHSASVTISNDDDSGNSFSFDISYTVSSPPPPSSDTWPDENGTGIGLRHPECPTTNPPTYTGPTTITQAGTHIFNVRINTQINIRANNVTVECAEISSPTTQRGIQIGASGWTASGTIVSKVKIHNVGDPNNINRGKCIYVTGYATNTLIEHSEFTDCEDGIQSEGTGGVYTHNWFHHMKHQAGLHSDPIAVQAGSNVLIEKNRFGPYDVVSAAIMIQPAGSCPNMTNIDLIENFIDGDGSGNTLLNDKSAGCTCVTNMDLHNNQFGPGAANPISYGTGDKQCPSILTRGGTCSGNKRFDGSAVGC